MNAASLARSGRLCAAGLSLTMAGGCGLMSAKSTEQPSFYSLDNAPAIVRPAARPASMLSSTAPTLIVSPPHAAAGFDSKRIIYVREAHKLEYYAHNQWVDTPARMYAPLIVAAVENTGVFRAVVQTPSAAAGDLRLDTEIIRLQHEFGARPSRVRFTLRAYIVDNPTRRVLAWREFDESSPASSEDPYGGVVAANRAVQAVLEQLASFCTEAAASWQPPSAENLKRAEGRSSLFRR
jgi:cholesterol transport system auxiliary component